MKSKKAKLSIKGGRLSGKSCLDQNGKIQNSYWNGIEELREKAESLSPLDAFREIVQDFIIDRTAIHRIDNASKEDKEFFMEWLAKRSRLIERAIKENEVHKYWLNQYIKIVHADLETTPLEFAKKVKLLESIEKELGIGLITLFKALKNGIYIKFDNGLISHKQLRYMKINCVVVFYDFNLSADYYFKDYGKTWALTKKELE